MGKSKEIPIEVRSQIIALYNHTSKSHRQIATVIGVSHYCKFPCFFIKSNYLGHICDQDY